MDYHAPMPAPIAPTRDDNRKVLTVSQLNRLARNLLEESFPAVLVEGEISNLSIPASGHWYLTLKDEQAQVRCAMFRNRNMLLRFKPKDGMQVVVKARLSLYEGRGDYQLIVEYMELAGAGALQRAFELLKARLMQEGLFDAARKKPLPALPRHVAVVTSPTGAAVRDIISVFRRRFPCTQLTIVPVMVQGEQSAPDLIKALATVNARLGCLHDVDVIVLARGGGSLEDLWSFNNEQLARAISASQLPVVSAVGHETDFTIADFVADVRAATPSAAAELLSPHQDEYRALLQIQLRKLRACMGKRLQDLQLQCKGLARRLRHPGRRLQEQAQRLDGLELRARRALQASLNQARHRIALVRAGLLRHSPDTALAQRQQELAFLTQRLQGAQRALLQRKAQALREQSHALHTVSPLATLARGYAIVTDGDEVLTSYEQTRPGATIRTRLAHGVLLSKVERVEKPEIPDPAS
jgi:exodeoxyribonuclease VII large subunit